MWQTQDNQLYKKFVFKNFAEALDFINQVGSLAEKMNHHPTIRNTYNEVEFWLSTHDADNQVTDKDYQLAEQIDGLLMPTEPPNLEMPTRVKMYSDGGSRGNPGPSASGYVITDMNDNILTKRGVYVGITTNNQAEYRSLQYGLEEALRLGAREVDVYMDSLLVINQMKGAYKVKNGDLWAIHDIIKKDLLPKFQKVTFTHVPRELNSLADAEVNTTLDAEARRG